MRQRAGKTLAVLISLVALAALGWALTRSSSPPHSGSQLTAPASPLGGSAKPLQLAVCGHPDCYTGVALATWSAARIAAWEKATGTHPGIAETYQTFGKPFPSTWARFLVSHRILPLIQIDPQGTSVADIAAGKDNGYLRAYAAEIKAAKIPVALSFGHEMNGHWYPWGYRHVPPSVFVTAWHVMHQVINAADPHVLWVWTVNQVFGRARVLTAPVRPWWPGAAYVNWVGLDTYYTSPRATFARAFAPTIRSIRSFTPRPILLTETAAGAWPRALWQINNLFANVRLYHLLGLIWFDQNGRQQWYLDNRPAALAAYHQGAIAFTRGG
jgi:glycosyl hydrolase family 26